MSASSKRVLEKSHVFDEGLCRFPGIDRDFGGIGKFGRHGPSSEGCYRLNGGKIFTGLGQRISRSLIRAMSCRPCRLYRNGAGFLLNSTVLRFDKAETLRMAKAAFRSLHQFSRLERGINENLQKQG